MNTLKTPGLGFQANYGRSPKLVPSSSLYHQFLTFTASGKSVYKLKLTVSNFNPTQIRY